MLFFACGGAALLGALALLLLSPFKVGQRRGAAALNNVGPSAAEVAAAANRRRSSFVTTNGDVSECTPLLK